MRSNVPVAQYAVSTAAKSKIWYKDAFPSLPSFQLSPVQGIPELYVLFCVFHRIIELFELEGLF